jgi:hypothetical protein
MTITVRKGLIGAQDVNWYSAASPTFSRVTSTGGATTLTSVSATNIPYTQGTVYFSQNTVERAIRELGYRVFTLTTPNTFGFVDGTAGTSIQAVASNRFLAQGFARVVIPNGTYTAATPIQLPRKCWIFGNGRATIFRASSTIQTSRVFTISGSLGATNSNLGANATIGTQIVSVVAGSKFKSGDWVYISDGTNSEIQQIRDKSGNDLKTDGLLRQTYRSAATTKSVTLLYPAELVIDNVDIQLSSATQGYGIAATYLVRSEIGLNTRISGYSDAGVLLQKSAQNRVEPEIFSPVNVNAGKGIGVRLSNSMSNRLGGLRDGSTKDVSDKPTNWIFGVNYRGPAVASGISDPTAFWYRNNKPKLKYATYGSTTVVACPSSANAPSEVYINGRIYKNTGTILCDLSRTIKPTAATVGGLDRGPAVATKAYYLYGVPSRNPSATRQWDLFASAGTPSGGPTAAGTFPTWTMLGAVVTTSSPVGVTPFVQKGDSFKFNRTFDLLSRGSATLKGYRPTYTEVPQGGCIPVGANSIIANAWSDNALTTNGSACAFRFLPTDLISIPTPSTATGRYAIEVSCDRVGTVSDYYSSISKNNVEIPVDITNGRYTFGYYLRPQDHFSGGPLIANATFRFGVECAGFVMDRSLYK